MSVSITCRHPYLPNFSTISLLPSNTIHRRAAPLQSATNIFLAPSSNPFPCGAPEFPCGSLSAAFQVAQFASAHNFSVTITAAAGRYICPPQPVELTCNLTIVGQGQNATLFDCSVEISTIFVSSSYLNLSSLSIINAASTALAVQCIGPGCTLSFDSISITNASSAALAIELVNTTSPSVSITRSVFGFNGQSTTTTAVAIIALVFTGSGVLTSPIISVSSSQFFGNSAFGSGSFSISLNQPGTGANFSLNNCTFTNNQNFASVRAAGAALSIQAVGLTASNISISASFFEGNANYVILNSGQVTAGGAAYLSLGTLQQSAVSVSSCSFIDNTNQDSVTSSGGALEIVTNVSNYSKIFIDNSYFFNNGISLSNPPSAGSLSFGGAVAVNFEGVSTACLVQLRNSSFFNNQISSLDGSAFGGAVSVLFSSLASSAYVHFFNLTAFNNSNAVTIDHGLALEAYGGALAVTFLSSAESCSVVSEGGQYIANNNQITAVQSVSESENSQFLLRGGAVSVALYQPASNILVSSISDSFSSNSNVGINTSSTYGGALAVFVQTSIVGCTLKSSGSDYTENSNHEGGMGGAVCLAIVPSVLAPTSFVSVMLESNLFKSNINSQFGEGGAVAIYSPWTTSAFTYQSSNNTFLKNSNACPQSGGGAVGGAVSINVSALVNSSISISADHYQTNINDGGSQGGAVAINTVAITASRFAVTRSHFTSNANFIASCDETVLMLGGALSLHASGPVTDSEITMNYCSFLSNSNSNGSGNGGAVSFAFQSSVTNLSASISNSLLQSNFNTFSEQGSPNMVGGAFNLNIAGVATNVRFHSDNISANSNQNACQLCGLNGNSASSGSAAGGAMIIMFQNAAESSSAVFSSSFFLSNVNNLGGNSGGALGVVFSQEAADVAVTVTRCTFAFNYQGGYTVEGAGLAVGFEDSIQTSSVTLDSNLFLNNSNQGSLCRGGAVYIETFAESEDVSLTIRNCSFASNTNSIISTSSSIFFANDGAAVFVLLNSSTSLKFLTQDCNFDHNSNTNVNASFVNSGGAVSVRIGTIMDSNITCANSSFNSNLNTQGRNYGGAYAIITQVLCQDSSVSLIESQFTNNYNIQGPSIGGAASIILVAASFCSVTTQRCRFTGNTNELQSTSGNVAALGSPLLLQGGALAVFMSDTVLVSITSTDCVFQNNSNLNLLALGSENTGGGWSIFSTGSADGLAVRSTNNRFTGCINQNGLVNAGAGFAFQVSSCSHCSFQESRSVYEDNYNSFLGGSDATDNIGGGLLVSFQQTALNTSVTVSNVQMTGNVNFAALNENNYHSNRGAGLAIAFNTSSNSCTVVVSGTLGLATFSSNSNTMRTMLLNNVNLGAGVYLFLSNSNADSITLHNIIFNSNLNVQSQNNINSNNYGGALSIMHNLVSNSSILVDLCTFYNNTNQALSTLASTLNFGAALSFFVVPPICLFSPVECPTSSLSPLKQSLSAVVRRCSFTNNMNVIKGGSAVRALGAGLSFAINKYVATTMQLQQLSFSQNDNTLSQATGASSATAIFGFYFGETVLSQTSLQSSPQTPISGMIQLNQRQLSASVLCAAAFNSQDLDVHDSFCTISCPAGQLVQNYLCVSPETRSDSLSVGECAGIGIGLGLGSLVVVVVLLVWSRWLLRRTHTGFAVERNTLTEQLLTNEREKEQLELEVTTLRRVWEIPFEELELYQEIGRGAFGKVFSGLWRDIAVAVKTVAFAGSGEQLHSSADSFMDTNPFTVEMDKEITMLQTVRHPNIVLFFGAGRAPNGYPFLVAELMERGTLTAVLAEPGEISWRQRLLFATDTARGMAHVHALGRIHRDLKSGNLLVSRTGRVKVADFGTATLVSLATEALGHEAPAARASTESTTGDLRHNAALTRGVGTPLWMAPEILAGQPYGPPADIYSFSIVLWEIGARALPWSEIESFTFLDDILKIVQSGRRPVADTTSWSAEYVVLMQRCWGTVPADRPTFAEVLPTLNRISP